MKKLLNVFMMLLVACSMLLAGCNAEIEENNSKTQKENTIQKENEAQKEASNITLSSIPQYSGNPYIAINDNEPTFSKEDMTTKSFETYSALDGLGRCGIAYANIGKDLMPTEKRGNISSVKPAGWKSVKYDHVDGKNLYNRCHLIGYQLTAENANDRNLITGTRYLNVEGMLPFENMIADYIKETGNHVLYKVEPIFEGDNLVASGVHMQGYSVEDEGEGISFNVYAYNVQPGVVIDYATGESKLGNPEEQEASASAADKRTGEKELTAEKSENKVSQTTNLQEANSTAEVRGNSRSKVYHCIGQADYDEMGNSKNLVVFKSEQEAIDAGYRKAKR